MLPLTQGLQVNLWIYLDLTIRLKDCYLPVLEVETKALGSGVESCNFAFLHGVLMAALKELVCFCQELVVWSVDLF